MTWIAPSVPGFDMGPVTAGAGGDQGAAQQAAVGPLDGAEEEGEEEEEELEVALPGRIRVLLPRQLLLSLPQLTHRLPARRGPDPA